MRVHVLPAKATTTTRHIEGGPKSDHILKMLEIKLCEVC